MEQTGQTELRRTAALVPGHARRSATGRKLRSSLLTALLVVGWLYLAVQAFAATPAGPTITYISNETSTASGNGTATTLAGGYIAVANLNTNQVADNWKGFVGNITGAFALLDGQGYQLYSWSMGTITGQVYAARANPVAWASLACANIPNITLEENSLGFTAASAPYDNITTTFFERYNHSAFTAADISFVADQCNYTTRAYVNSSAPIGADTDFEQIILTDGPNRVYTTLIENNRWGFRTNWTFDYQIIVPHNTTLATATTYYLFVELV